MPLGGGRGDVKAPICPTSPKSRSKEFLAILVGLLLCDSMLIASQRFYWRAATKLLREISSLGWLRGDSEDDVLPMRGGGV